MPQPILLCGLGRMGWPVLEYLTAAGFPVVAIDVVDRSGDARLNVGGGVRFIQGDCRRREILESAGVAEAAGVLMLVSDDLTNLSATLMVRSLNPTVRIVLRMFNQNLINRLGQAIHNVFALSTSLLTAPILAMTAVTGQGLGAFRLEGSEAGTHQIIEAEVQADSILCGRTVVEVTGPQELQVVAHIPASGAARFLLEVDPEARLAAGDRLVVCGATRPLQTLLAGSKGEEPPHLLWAGKIRRFARVARRTLAEIDALVIICTCALVLVIALSTAVLTLGVADYTPADALFRTVSIMATGGEMKEPPAGWLKVYIAALRLVGAALTGAFTAIITNYLLRARLGGALEVRRIPESGHFIVCGLSPIGFRVVEELIGWGERVVAIEVDAANRFVTTAPRLGAAVVIGDAAIPEVLRQAHGAMARAVVATTDNDVVNLEVALLARELNGEQRVVLLQSDPHMAKLLREAANVHLAVSAPTLSAPAFVAALFGDLVRNVLMVRGRMLALVDLNVQPKDPILDGAAVRTVAVDYHLLPVALVPAQGEPPRYLLNARLAAGDRLLGIVVLTDLERLLRRQPSSAAWATEVTGFPLPARGWLAGLVRTQWGVGMAEAEAALDRLPLRFSNLTRGQAEDLLARLLRERITARVCAVELEPSTS